MTKARRQAGLIALVLLGVTACAGGRTPEASSYTGPGPVGHRPVLDACPPSARSAGLPQTRLPCFVGGPPVNMAALGGRPSLVNLWASWCGPCQREMPALQKAYARYHSQIAFLGVDTTDDRDSANDFLGTIGIHYPQVSDLRGDVLHRVGGPGLPVTLVLSANGAVVYSHRGQLKPADLMTALTAAGIARPAVDAGMMTPHHPA